MSTDVTSIAAWRALQAAGGLLPKVCATLKEVQSTVTVCRLALLEQRAEADHHVARLLERAIEQLGVTAEVLRNPETEDAELLDEL